MSAQLTVVGTGIRFGLQLTPEALGEIKGAEVVLYAVNDPLKAAQLHQLNAGSRSMVGHYAAGRDRRQTYDLMVGEILSELDNGKRVCAVFYGHPGVGVDPGHEAVSAARASGFRASMLPGVSAADCMYADLGIDPVDGLGMYAATDFLTSVRYPDPTAGLILWQIGAVGHSGPFGAIATAGLDVLQSRLIDIYGAAHEVAIYHAALYAGIDPTIRWVRLAEVARSVTATTSSLYVPPLRAPHIDHDMAAILGVEAKPPSSRKLRAPPLVTSSETQM